MEVTNDELYEIQEKLVDVQADVLGQIKDLLKWKGQNPYRKGFLLELVKYLKDEQIKKFPHLIILEECIKADKELTGESLVDWLDKNIHKSYIDFINALLGGKEGELPSPCLGQLNAYKQDIIGINKTFLDESLFYPNTHIYNWVDSFGIINSMKNMINKNPELFQEFTFNAITKEQFLANFPGMKPLKPSRQTWVYELNPELLDNPKSWSLINTNMIILPSSLIKNHPEYAPSIVFPFIRQELFGAVNPVTKPTKFEVIDSLANGIPVDEFHGDLDYIITKTKQLLEYRPSLFPILSDFITKVSNSFTKEHMKLLAKCNPFLYRVLLEKGLAEQPTEGDEILFEGFKGTPFNGTKTIIAHDARSKVSVQYLDDYPQMKDPQYIINYGYSILQDDLEEFIKQNDGKVETILEFWGSNLPISDLAASFGAERIWNWLRLNGRCNRQPNECRAFSGRNQQIIKEVLKISLPKKPLRDLLNSALNAYNLEVFAYLIETNEIEVLDFARFTPLRFIQKVKFPLIGMEEQDMEYIDRITECFVGMEKAVTNKMNLPTPIKHFLWRLMCQAPLDYVHPGYDKKKVIREILDLLSYQ